MSINALGFIEVVGLATAIEASDAMLKSANVRLLTQQILDPALVSVVIEGDLAACRAAVNAGVAAAERIGTVVSQLVIGRPTDDCEYMVTQLLRQSKGGLWQQLTQVPASIAPVAQPAPVIATPVVTQVPPEPKTAPVALATQHIIETVVQVETQTTTITEPSEALIELDQKWVEASDSVLEQPAASQVEEETNQHILTSLQSAKNGLLQTELQKKFPHVHDLKKRLDQLLSNGSVHKKKQRYVVTHRPV